MNSLSWFLYVAQVVPALGGFLVCIGIVTFCVTAGWCFIGGMNKDCCSNARLWESWKWHFKHIHVWLIPLTLFLGLLVPNTNTMYAIAASQVGEQVVKSEAVQGIASDATKALQIWIKKQAKE